MIRWRGTSRASGRGWPWMVRGVVTLILLAGPACKDALPPQNATVQLQVELRGLDSLMQGRPQTVFLEVRDEEGRTVVGAPLDVAVASTAAASAGTAAPLAQRGNAPQAGTGAEALRLQVTRSGDAVRLLANGVGEDSLVVFLPRTSGTSRVFAPLRRAFLVRARTERLVITAGPSGTTGTSPTTPVPRSGDTLMVGAVGDTLWLSAGGAAPPGASDSARLVSLPAGTITWTWPTQAAGWQPVMDSAGGLRGAVPTRADAPPIEVIATASAWCVSACTARRMLSVRQIPVQLIGPPDSLVATSLGDTLTWSWVPVDGRGVPVPGTPIRQGPISSSLDSSVVAVTLPTASTGRAIARGAGVVVWRAEIPGTDVVATRRLIVAPSAVTLRATQDTVFIVGLSRLVGVRFIAQDRRGHALPVSAEALEFGWQGPSLGRLSVRPADATIEISSTAAGRSLLLVRWGTLTATVPVVVALNSRRLALVATPDTLPALSDTMIVEAQVVDDAGAVPGVPIRFHLVDTSLATVDSLTGRVVSRRNGTTWLRASTRDAAQLQDSVRVVIAQRVARVAVTPPALLLTVADSLGLQATPVDRRGHPVEGVPVTWSSLTGIASVSGAGMVRGMGVGTATVLASGGGITTPATVLIAPPFTRSSDSTRVPVPVTVALGPTAAGTSVRWSTTSGVVDSPSSMVSPEGTATTGWRLPATVGGAALRATWTDVGGPALGEVAVLRAAVTPGRAVRLVLQVGNNQTATVGTALPGAIRVLATDAAGNPVPGARLSARPIAGGGALPDSAFTTDSTGVAGIAPWSLGPTRGLNTLLVRLPTDSVLVSATGEAGAGARLVGPAPDTLVVQPGRRLALRAQIADALGNRLSIGGLQVTARVSAGDPRPITADTVGTTDATGEALLPAVRVAGRPGGRTISAWAPGLLPRTWHVRVQGPPPVRGASMLEIVSASALGYLVAGDTARVTAVARAAGGEPVGGQALRLSAPAPQVAQDEPATYTDTLTGAATGRWTATRAGRYPVALLWGDTLGGARTSDTLALVEVEVRPAAPVPSATLVGPFPSTLLAGQTDTVRVTLRDRFGNRTGLQSAVALAAPTGTGLSIWTIGPAVMGADTVWRIPVTGLMAGAPTALTPVVDGVPHPAAVLAHVVPAALSVATSTVTPTTIALASGESREVVLRFRDAQGNGLADGVTVTGTVSGGGSTASLGAVTYVAADSTYRVSVVGAVAGSPSVLQLTANGVALPPIPVVVSVGPVDAGTSTVVLTPSEISSGGTGEAVITLRDAAGNRLGAGAAVAMRLSGGTATALVGTPTYVAGDSTYRVTLTGVRAGAATTIVEADGVTLTAALPVTVRPGPVVASSAVGPLPLARAIVVGQTDSVVVTPQDAAGNKIGDGLTVTVTTGTSDIAIGPVAFRAADSTYVAVLTGTSIGGAHALQVAVDGVALTAVPVITVLSALDPNTTTAVGSAPTAVVEGSPMTITITPRDAGGNLLFLPQAVVVATADSGTSLVALGAPTFAPSDSSWRIAVSPVGTGSPRRLTVSIDGIVLTAAPTLQVVPGATSSLVLANGWTSLTNPDTAIFTYRTASGSKCGTCANSILAVAPGAGTGDFTLGAPVFVPADSTFRIPLIGATVGSREVTALIDGRSVLGAPPTLRIQDARSLTWSGAPTAALGAPLSPAPVVTLVDSVGRPVRVAGRPVVTTASLGAVDGTTSAVTDANGQATFTNLILTGAGTRARDLTASWATASGTRTLSPTGGVVAGVAGAVIWNRGDLGVVREGQGVSRWHSIGSLDFDAAQSTPSARPDTASATAFNSQRVVRFSNTTNNWMVWPVTTSPVFPTNATFSGGMTVFAVVNSSANRGHARIFEISCAGGSGCGQVYLGRAGGNPWIRWRTNWSSAIARGGEGMLPNVTPAVLITVAQAAGSSTRMRQRGTLFDSTFTGNSAPTIGGTARTTGYLGWSATSAADGRWAGDIAELIIFGRTLTLPEIEQVEAYLRTRYGIGHTLAMQRQPSATAASGVAFAIQPEVRITDNASGLGLAGVPITASIQSGPGGTLSVWAGPFATGSLTVRTNDSGIASYSGLQLTGPSGTYVLRFSAPDGTVVASSTITIP